MKKFLLPFLIVIAVVLYHCENENHEKHNPLHYLKTIYGGCNNPAPEKSTVSDIDNDTVMIRVNNDTLSLFVGVNYVCCAYFEGKSEFVGDSLHITVADTCADGDQCYCHCLCYYTFDFLYDNIATGEIPCKVRLWDALAEKYTVLFKGTIIINKQ